MKAIARKIARSRYVACWFHNYRWFRKLHGGRWELWWITMCGNALWLDISENRPDDHRQPCSEGPRMAREDHA